MEGRPLRTDASVLVIDDEPRMRSSLSRLLRSAGLRAETYGSAEEFLENYRPPARGCLIVDACLEPMSGLELQEQLRAREVPLPIIFISGYAEVPLVVQAMKAGAINFLEKPFDDDSLLRSVAQAIERHDEIKREHAWRNRAAERLQTLTPREREIMDLLVSGNHTKMISKKLGISPKTVDIHRAKVLEKMQVDGVVNLVNLIHRFKPACSTLGAGALIEAQRSSLYRW